MDGWRTSWGKWYMCCHPDIFSVYAMVYGKATFLDSYFRILSYMASFMLACAHTKGAQAITELNWHWNGKVSRVLIFCVDKLVSSHRIIYVHNIFSLNKSAVLHLCILISDDPPMSVFFSLSAEKFSHCKTSLPFLLFSMHKTLLLSSNMFFLLWS